MGISLACRLKPFHFYVVKYLLSSKLEIFQVVKHTGSDQLLLITRMMQGSMQTSSHFSTHPAAAGSFFTLLLFGLKLCDCLRDNGHCTGTFGASLLHDHIHRYVSPFQQLQL